MINIALYLIIRHLRLFNEYSIYKILYKHGTLQIMMYSLIFYYSAELQLIQLTVFIYHYIIIIHYLKLAYIKKYSKMVETISK